MKSKLLDESTIEALLAVKSIEEVIELLEENAYKDELVEFSTKYAGVELVNRAVTANFAKIMKKIAAFLPNGSNALLEIVLEEWTIQNLKAIIASKATGIPVNTANLSNFNKEQQSLMAIASDPSLDLQKTVHKLAISGYSFSGVFHKIENEHFRNGAIGDWRVLFRELESYYFEKLGNAAEHESDSAVKVLLMVKIDFVNTMMIARLKLAGVDKEEIKANIIKKPTRNKREMHHLIEKETIGEVVEEIVKTHKLNESVTIDFQNTNSLVKLEVELERRLIQKALRTSKVAVLSFAVILAYIYLKQQEVAFLKAIAYSTQAGISQELKQIVFTVK